MNSTGKIVNGERRYGTWAGNPKGTPEDPTRCIREVFLGDRGGTHYQCNRRRGFGEGGLYCRQHDPAAVAGKTKAINDAWSARQVQQEAIEKKGEALARKLGIRGEALYYSATRFKDCGFIEKLVISFADAEKLVAKLENGDRGKGKEGK